MSLGFRPYLVAFASLIAGASVIHAVLQPDLVRGKREGERRRERERERRRGLIDETS